MSYMVRMPELMAGAEEATIARWLVTAGDEVEVGQEIAEIETEKATVEFEAEQAGKLAQILVDAGHSVAVGTPLAVIAADGENVSQDIAEHTSPEPALTGATPAPTVATPADTTTPPHRRFASPLVRKLARENGLDLTGVRGSGPGGRIVRRDITALLDKGVTPATEVKQATEQSRASTSAPAQSSESFTEIPHTGMRKAIARRLSESKATVPHYYLVSHINMDALLELRSQINALEGVKVSVNDFVVKAVGAALIDVPEANAIWSDTSMRQFTDADVAIAVAVPGGLLTPVIRGVNKLSLSALSKVTRDFAERARDGKIKQAELEGGTFSVSNLGMFGISEFSAIINPPHAGILAVGAAEKRLVLGENDEWLPVTQMTVTLSADHRVIDGALGAQWINALCSYLENPLRLLI